MSCGIARRCIMHREALLATPSAVVRCGRDNVSADSSSGHIACMLIVMISDKTRA